jgi:hypothetical protein
MWPYRIIDDFFSPGLYSELAGIPYDHLAPDERFQSERNEYWRDDRIVARSFCEDLIVEIHNESFHQLAGVISDIAPGKMDRWLYTRIFMQQIGKDYAFSIHDERAEKFLTAVVYLAPEVNKGTLLYTDHKGNGKEEIPWIPNRAFVYVPKKTVTWHSFEGDGISNRSTLIINFIRE